MFNHCKRSGDYFTACEKQECLYYVTKPNTLYTYIYNKKRNSVMKILKKQTILDGSALMTGLPILKISYVKKINLQEIGTY